MTCPPELGSENAPSRGRWRTRSTLDRAQSAPQAGWSMPRARFVTGRGRTGWSPGPPETGVGHPDESRYAGRARPHRLGLGVSIRNPGDAAGSLQFVTTSSTMSYVFNGTCIFDGT